MRGFTFGPLEVLQFPCLSDNYGFLLHDTTTGVTAAVDTPEVGPIVAALEEKGWSLDLILNTHWHADHTGGNAELKDRYGTTIVGPRGEESRIEGIDRPVSEGDVVEIGAARAEVWETPGHTSGHIVFVLPERKIAFVGDTLFSLGCGRLFEGSPEEMWRSLTRLRDLGDDWTLFCAHEYTAANADFALSLDENTEALREKREEIAALREKGEPTVPLRMEEERRLNPFLRADADSLAAAVGLSNAAPAEVFGEVRRRKDNF